MGASSMYCLSCGAPLQEGAEFCMGCGAKAKVVDPLVGQTIGRGFRLDALIGVGGMGRVYKAEQVALGRTVAVKVLHNRGARDPERLRRFEAEARAAGVLDHPNSVSVLDFGETDDGAFFLVMEHIDGEDLGKWLEERGTLEPEEAVDVLGPALGALQEAHTHGIVHRDLKPENLMIARSAGGRRVVKVVDFGLAKLKTETSRTQAGAIFGTPVYMSPEHMSDRELDARTDIYAMGVMLFELLTGSVPFDANSAPEILMKHVREPIPDPRKRAPERRIPPPFAGICMKAMAKDPDERYQTAADMRRALQAARDAIAVKPGTTVCRGCGARTSAEIRFCGSCGARLAVHSFMAPPPTEERASLPPAFGPSAFFGREREMEALDAAARTEGAFAWMHVTGPMGSGRSRLLEEYRTKATAAGDLVLFARPHPLRLPIPYFGVRALLAQLAEAPARYLSGVVETGHSYGASLVHAGMLGALEGLGVEGLRWTSRVGAVRHALGAAIRQRAQAADVKRVVLVCDDLVLCDPFTRRVLADLHRERLVVPTLLLTSGKKVKHPRLRPLELGALHPRAHYQLVQALQIGDIAEDIAELRDTDVGLPLYMEQLGRLPADTRQLMPTALEWPRLADLIFQRLDELDPTARRLLSMAALCGDWAKIDALKAAVPDELADRLGELADGGWLTLTGDRFSFHHPLLRDVAVASVPVQRRREMHGAIFASLGEDDELETRGFHAAAAADLHTPELLDRIGDQAREAGEPTAAYRAYSGGFEYARAAAMQGYRELLGSAWTFVGKTADALRASGGRDEAISMLVDAVTTLPAAEPRRLTLAAQLALVKLEGDDVAGAEEVLRAIEGIEAPKEVRARILVARARVLQARGTHSGAAELLKEAAELRIDAKEDDALIVRTLLELSDRLVDAGDRPAAERALRWAQSRPAAEAYPALASRITGREGRISAVADPARGALLLREAARLAAEAGDEAQHLAWRAEADELV